MFKNKKLNRIIVFSIAAFAVGFIGFVGKKQSEIVFRSINISIDNQLGNYFIDDKDVMDIVTGNNSYRIIGERFEDVDLRLIERKLELHEFIYNAEVHKDLKGNLNVHVFQAKPVARILEPGKKDKYISKLGEVIPTSTKYTSRVLLISGHTSQYLKEKNLHDDEYSENLLQMIDFINHNPFWKAMVAQLEIDKRGNVSIYTQVSKQVIDFGQPENLESKFKRLNIFYDKILPSEGWNSYERVSVKFENQIVCE